MLYQLSMRPSEQYGLDWTRVDLTRNYIRSPYMKNGKARHIRLNAVAVAAFKVVQKRSLSRKGEVFVSMKGEPLHGYKHWFDPAVEESWPSGFYVVLLAAHVRE